VTAFTVPRYLAETARRDHGVHDWIAGLPAIVADLAGRWSLVVDEPFQPGGQCSWTAPVTDPAGAGLVFARSVQESIGSPLMRQVAARLAPA
jgi:streptomycin 6-kinase